MTVVPNEKEKGLRDIRHTLRRLFEHERLVIVVGHSTTFEHFFVLLLF
jgi:hypothetical protein